MKKPGEVGQPKDIAGLVEQVQACTVCAANLPHSPRPVLRVSSTASLLIVGQAPGRRVHATGIPWNDPSGDRLRDWLGMTRDAFYDVSRIAIVPTGLCYPGTVKGSDLAPRPECAPLWHPTLRAAMPDIHLTLLIGAYAQAYYLGKRRGRTLADTVAAWRDFLPDYFPLPHPSPVIVYGSNVILGSIWTCCRSCENGLEHCFRQAIMAAPTTTPDTGFEAE